MQNYKAEDKIVTGILFIEADAREIHDTMNTTAVPLRDLSEKELCPGAGSLEEINTLHR